MVLKPFLEFKLNEIIFVFWLIFNKVIENYLQIKPSHEKFIIHYNVFHARKLLKFYEANHTPMSMRLKGLWKHDLIERPWYFLVVQCALGWFSFFPSRRCQQKGGRWGKIRGKKDQGGWKTKRNVQNKYMVGIQWLE